MTVWDDLVGQDAAVEVLRTAAGAAREIHAGRDAAPGAMTHAWLFTGPAGSGRSVAARAFAAALECVRDGEPGCGECSGCHTTLGRSHPDVHAVVPEGLSISVAEMRAVVATAARLPALGRWQVVVIEDAEHPDDVSVTIRSRCRLVSLRIPPAEAIADVLRRGGVDAETATWAAQAGQGHVGRSRRLARDEAARARRAEVLAIPASLTSLQACLDAADHLVRAAEGEAAAISIELSTGETEALQIALGAGGTGKGTAAATRGTAGAVRELERRQKSRATRMQRDALDRALVDLAAFYRDVLLVHAGAAVPPAHPDFADDARSVAARLTAPGTLQRLDAVLACREALELNVKPRIAVEAMTAALRLP